MTTVSEEEEYSEDQAGDGEGEDYFFDKAEFSDDKIDDNGWESGSINSEDGGFPVGLPTTSASLDSGSEPETESSSMSDANSPYHLRQKTKSKVKLRPESVSGDDDESNPDSDSDTPSSLAQGKVLNPSRGAGTSIFLPSLSVGYIPGTGDSDPEDELEAVGDKSGRKNRRGQRARRA